MRFSRTSQRATAAAKLLACLPETASQVFCAVSTPRSLSWRFFYLFPRLERVTPLLVTSFLHSHSLGASLASVSVGDCSLALPKTHRQHSSISSSLFRTISRTCGILSLDTRPLLSLARSLYSCVMLLLLTLGCALVSSYAITKAMAKKNSTYGIKNTQRT